MKQASRPFTNHQGPFAGHETNGVAPKSAAIRRQFGFVQLPQQFHKHPVGNTEGANGPGAFIDKIVLAADGIHLVEGGAAGVAGAAIFAVKGSFVKSGQHFHRGPPEVAAGAVGNTVTHVHAGLEWRDAATCQS